MKSSKYNFSGGILTRNSDATQVANAELPTITAHAAITQEIILTTETQASLAQYVEQQGDDLFEAFCDFMGCYELPLGLLNEINTLDGCKQVFIVDDSGSMTNKTDVLYQNALSSHIKNKGLPEQFMTRFEEAQDRIYALVHLLSFTKIKEVTIKFLNRQDSVCFSFHPEQILLNGNQATLDPQKSFLEHVNQAMANVFNVPLKRNSKTPIRMKLNETYEQAYREPLDTVTCVTLLCDGIPTPKKNQLLPHLENPAGVTSLVKNRQAPHRTPTSIMACTSIVKDISWIFDLDEDAPYTDAHDDPENDAKMIRENHTIIHVNKGLILLCSLLGAKLPHLDAINDACPMTRYTLSRLQGYEVPEDIYKSEYWDRNIHAELLVQYMYADFSNKQMHAHTILGENSRDHRVNKTLEEKGQDYLSDRMRMLGYVNNAPSQTQKDAFQRRLNQRDLDQRARGRADDQNHTPTAVAVSPVSMWAPAASEAVRQPPVVAEPVVHFDLENQRRTREETTEEEDLAGGINILCTIS